MDPMTMMMIASAASSMLGNSGGGNSSQQQSPFVNPFQQKQIPQLSTMESPKGYLELLKQMSRGG